MRTLSTLFWLLLVAVVVCTVAIGYACLSPIPLVGEAPPLTTANIERAKALLAEHDVRRLRDDEVKTIAVSADVK